jgi:hypothetical protein
MSNENKFIGVRGDDSLARSLVLEFNVLDTSTQEKINDILDKWAKRQGWVKYGITHGTNMNEGHFGIITESYFEYNHEKWIITKFE